MNPGSARSLARRLVFLLPLAGIVVAAPPAIAQQDPVLARARKVLRKHPVVDGHNDLPWQIREVTGIPGDVEAYDLRKRTSGATDLERLREGGVGGQFWSVYIPPRPRATSCARSSSRSTWPAAWSPAIRATSCSRAPPTRWSGP